MAARRPRTARERESRRKALGVAGLMRRDPLLSLKDAARLNGTSPRTVRKYTPGNFSRPSGSRPWKVKAGDSYWSEARVLTAQGWQTIPVKGSKQRSLLGQYANAVEAFKRGDPDGADRVRAFRGKQIGGYELMIDEGELDIMAGRQELDEWDVGSARWSFS